MIEIKPNPFVLIETSVQTYSLSEEGFVYN